MKEQPAEYLIFIFYPNKDKHPDVRFRLYFLTESRNSNYSYTSLSEPLPLASMLLPMTKWRLPPEEASYLCSIYADASMIEALVSKGEQLSNIGMMDPVDLHLKVIEWLAQ